MNISMLCFNQYNYKNKISDGVIYYTERVRNVGIFTDTFCNFTVICIPIGYYVFK